MSKDDVYAACFCIALLTVAYITYRLDRKYGGKK